MAMRALLPADDPQLVDVLKVATSEAVSAMTSSQSANDVASGAWALGSLAWSGGDEERPAPTVEPEQIAAIIATLRRYTEPEVQAACLRCLRNLAYLNEANCEAMINGGAMSLAIQAATPAASGVALEEDVVEEALLLMANTCALSAAARSQALNQGAVDCALATLRANTAYGTRTCAQACRTLAHLSTGEPTVKTQATGADALESLVDVMLKSPESSLLQAQACAALSALVAYDMGTQKRAVAAGCVEAVLAALKAHYTSSDVTFRGLSALANLVANTMDGRRKANAGGALSTVLGAMPQHPSSPQVASEACRCVLNLVSNDDRAAEKAVAAGAIEAVTAALKANANNSEVLEQGFRAIASLCWGPTAKNKAKAHELGADSLIETLSRKWRDDDVIQEWSTKALEKIGPPQ